MAPHHTRRSLVLLVACALAAAAPGASADEETPAPATPPATAAPAAAGSEDTSELEALLGDAVVTTASLGAERASIAPATVFTISAAEMRSGGMKSVDEALELLGLGLYIARPRDYTSGVDVGAQGLLLRDGGRHVLVMLDGVILNSQGTGRVSVNEGIGVPLGLIDHIEVMLGPGSVTYGSNAMLAVINVVTRRARDLDGVEATAELGSAMAQDDRGNPTTSAGTRPGLRYRLSLGGGHRFKLWGAEGEATAMVEWVHELSASYGITPFTMANAGNQSLLPGQAAWGGDASHTLQAPSGTLVVRLGGLRLLVNAFGYSRGMPLVGTFNDPTSREAQSGTRLDLRYVWEASQRLTLTSRLYGGYSQLSETSTYGEAFWCLAEQQQGCRMETSARSGWAGAAQELSADWLLDGRLVTTVGYDARLRTFDGTPATYRDLVTGALPSQLAVPHASALTFLGALFAQQIWRPLGWLHVNVGARLDLDDQHGTRLSPRAALVFTPTTSTVLRLSYNEAFRAPSMYELTEFDPVYRVTPSALRPETVRSVEVEVQQRVWRLNLALRGYASFYRDFIESRTATPAEVAMFDGRLSPTVDPSLVLVNDNLTELHVFGGSAALGLQLASGLALGGSVNVARTQTADGAVQELLPFWYGNLRAGWHSSDDRWSVMLLGVYASSRQIVYTASATDRRLDPRLDLRLSASGPFGGVRGLDWRASIGFDLNPWLPYQIASGTDTASGQVLYPDQPRLSAFVGLRYQHRGL